MAALVYGSVTVNDDGVASFVPPDPTQSVSGIIYTAELAAIDEYTAANGGEVPPDNERVATLKWFALRSNKIAEGLVTYLNANL